jgi:hypothetical protein
MMIGALAAFNGGQKCVEWRNGSRSTFRTDVDKINKPARHGQVEARAAAVRHARDSAAHVLAPARGPRGIGGGAASGRRDDFVTPADVIRQIRRS